MALTVLLLVVEILMLVSGQIFWKMGVEKIGAIHLNNIMLLATSWHFWAGVMIYGMATILWMVIISRANLSTVYPMQSLAYVFAVFSSIIIFGEKVSTAGWVGLAFIIAGVFVTSNGLR